MNEPQAVHVVECFCAACDARRAERRRLTARWIEKFTRDYIASGGARQGGAVDAILDFHIAAFSRLLAKAMERGEHISFLDN